MEEVVLAHKKDFKCDWCKFLVVEWIAQDERRRKCRNDKIENRYENRKGCDEFEPPFRIKRSELWGEHKEKVPKAVDTVELAVEDGKLKARYELPEKKLPLFRFTVEIRVSNRPLTTKVRKVYINARKEDEAVQKMESLINERNWKLWGDLEAEYIGKDYDIQPDTEKFRRKLSLPKEERE